MDPHPKFFFDDSGTLHLNAGGYGTTIEIACFTPDGARLLTVREVGLARVWDVASGALMGLIQPTSPLEHSDAGPTTRPFQVFIEAAALSPDGAHALLGLNDGTAGIFTVAGGERLCTLHHPAVPPASDWRLVRAVAFAPDGRRLAVGFLNRTVGLWDGPGAQLLALLQDPDQRPFNFDHGPRPALTCSLCFSADGRYLLAGYSDGTVTLWDTSLGTPVLQATEHIERIVGLWLAGEEVRWATDAGTVWAAGAGGTHRLLRAGASWLAADFSPDGATLLATTLRDFQRWSLPTGGCARMAHSFPPNSPNAIPRARFAPAADAHFIPLGAAPLLVGAQSETTIQRAGPLGHWKLTPDGTRLVTAGAANRIEVWSADGAGLGSLDVSGAVQAVALSADGRLVAAASGPTSGGSQPPMVQAWRVDDGALLGRLRGPTQPVVALGFGPGGAWLVGASRDTVYRWDLGGPAGADLEPVITLTPASLMPPQLLVLADGRVLIVRRDCIEVWHELTARITTIYSAWSYDDLWQVSGDGSRLVLGSHGQRVQVWSLADGALLHKHAAAIPRTMELFTEEILLKLWPRIGALLWSGPGGPYLTVGDGPRGWATALPLAPDRGCVVVPGMKGAGLIALETPPRLIQLVPFEGRLRAGCITADRVLLINDAGALYQAPRQARDDP